MGKRNLRKYKNKTIMKSKDKGKGIDNEIEEEQIVEFDKANLTNLQYLISKLQSTDTSDKENITSFLSTYHFNTSDITLKETIFNESFLRSLVLLLNDTCFQIKYNAISALINLIMYYNEDELESFLLNQTSFITVSVDLLNQFIIIDNKNTSEHVKILKTYHNFLELLMLLFDLYNEDTYQSIDFSPIEKCLIELIVTNKTKVNEDLCTHINIVLCNIFSVRIENANEKQWIQMYITEALLVLNNSKETNDVIKSSMISGLFYLICSNYELFKAKDATIIQKVIAIIYYGLANQNNKGDAKALNDMIKGLIKNENENDNGNNKNNNNAMINTNVNVITSSSSSPEAMIKLKMKALEQKTKSLSILMVVFSDIIENLELPSIMNNDSNTKNIHNDDLYEEIDNEEDNEIINEDSSPNTISSYSKLISKSLSDLFSMDNYSSLQTMISQSFIMNLLNLFCIEHISDYFINDMDKLLIIKDTIIEIEYHGFSLINNLIDKVPKLFESSPQFLKEFFSLCVSRLQISETNKDEDSLSIVVLSLRNLFNQFKQINTIISLSSIDYSKIFILIHSTNDSLVDPFTKMNLIDIIAYSFSYPGISIEDNLKVCMELKGLFFKENKIEVLSHVVNAFMDIYKEDDITLNKNLKASEVITLMNNGVNAFRDKMRQARSNEEIDKDGYAYVKETLINMKRFIKYKEASFIQLNI